LLCSLLLLSRGNGAAQEAPTGVVFPPGQPVHLFQVNFSRFGPFPRTHTQPAGPFILVIRPHWRGVETEDTFTLRLKQAAATTGDEPPLYRVLAGQHHEVDFKQLNLLPGTYEIVFSNHPLWTVTLTVTK
jgi:hypothetical protein